MSISVQDQLREFIVENFLFGDTTRPVASSMSLIENDLVDSTGILELVAFMEDRFGFTVADHEIVPDNLDSLDKLAAYITAKMNVDASSTEAATQAA
jgi:acyl carrier protein